MDCPACGTAKSRVKDTFDGAEDKRKRECPCGATWRTTETVDKGSLRTPGDRQESMPASTNRQGSTGKPPDIDKTSPLSANVGGGVGGALSGDRSGPDSGSLSDPPVDPLQQVDRARAKRKTKRSETPAFVAFYAAFPRKVARDAAWKAWESKGCEDVAGEIMSALAWQVPQVFRPAPADKVPHPASWLNAGRWKDERPSAAALRPARPAGPPIAVAELAAERAAKLAEQARQAQAAEAERFQREKEADQRKEQQG